MVPLQHARHRILLAVVFQNVTATIFAGLAVVARGDGGDLQIAETMAGFRQHSQDVPGVLDNRRRVRWRTGVAAVVTLLQIAPGRKAHVRQDATDMRPLLDVERPRGP